MSAATAPSPRGPGPTALPILPATATGDATREGQPPEHPRPLLCDDGDLTLRLIVILKAVKGTSLAVLTLLLLWPGGRALETAQRFAAWMKAHPPLGHAGLFLLDHLSPRSVSLVAVLVATGTVLFYTEAVGLYCRRRWAAWLTVASTSLLVPVEVQGLLDGRGVGSLLALCGNLAVVIILAFKVRREASIWHA